ncbi:hypothetical protein IGB42_00733 [Andreprevotia sp. IGB-42]|uniref:DUF4350 domain-containing protein n=1 Tax=Andreprevotia sp. IGB-42 TaxID=2497473 RepID=UPI001357C1AC|nr:DUF4350 domain-containing protein [Andreprevotia sp. IGB-42]KAF0814678.1 hypothetical protein IGB42_00733 [Andreprevotia sp. IGB-42]
MSRVLRWIAAALLLALVAYGSWWWAGNMERQPDWVFRLPQRAALENPLLAAERYLQRRGLQTVAEESVHGVAAQLHPHDTLLALQINDDLPLAEQQALLGWVRRGGVLVTSITLYDEEDDEVLAENAIVAPLQLRVRSDDDEGAGKPGDVAASGATAAGTLQLTPPGSAYPLTLTELGYKRLAPAAAVPPAWQDSTGQQMFAYRMGQGWLVVLNNSRLFDRHALAQRDHAEFLWRLATLNPGKVWLARGGTPKVWYARLWHMWPQAVLMLALLLALLLWNNGVRFGPLLPQAAPPRRALLEHIRASARWAWRHDGRAALLQAARRSTLALIATRVPEWSRLPPDELARRLATRYDLPQADIDAALNQARSDQPAAFTAAVATLQTLRNKL